MSFIKVLTLAAVATVAVVVSDAAVIKLDAAPPAPKNLADCVNKTFDFGHCDCRSSECATTTSICCDSKLNKRTYCAAGADYDAAWNNLAQKEPKCFM